MIEKIHSFFFGKHKLGILLILLSFVNFGFCTGIFDLEQPKITDSYPKNNETGIPNKSIIWIQFSEDMDHPTVENGFSLSSDGGKVKGEISWESNRLIFTPKLDLSTGVVYTLGVLKSAEDLNGNDLKDNYEIKFTVNKDSKAPTLVSFSPTHGQNGVLPGTILTWVFSEPVDMASLLSGITISPSVVGDFTANATGETVTFTPYNPLVYGTLYTINVTTAVKDIAGNPLFEGTNYSFIIGTDFIKPSIISATSGPATFSEGIQTTGISKNDPITITFSELMDINKALNAINISPAIFSTQSITAIGVAPNQQTQITYTPISPLEPETMYQLVINTAAVDIAGNLLDKTYTYPFFTNAPDSIRPIVLGVREQMTQANSGVCSASLTTFCTYGACSSAGLGVCQRAIIDPNPVTGTLPNSPSYLSQNSVLDIKYQVDINPAIDDPAANDLRLVLNVYFDKPMDFTTLTQAVTLSTIVSAAQNPAISHIQLTGGGQILQIYFDKMIYTGAYYKLIIKGGIAKDTLGNALKTDFILLFYV